MQLGSYQDGRPLNYAEETGQFDIGGSPVSSSDVLAWDAAGQITWLSEDIRTWAHQLGAPAAPAAPEPVVATPVTGAYPAPSYPAPGYAMPTPISGPAPRSGLPTWAIVLIVIAILGVLGCCGIAILGGALNTTSTGTSGSGTSTGSYTDTGSGTDSDSGTDSGDVTPEEEAYAAAVTAITNETADALTELGNILTEDPAGVFTDKSVQADLFEQADIIKGGYDAVLELDPPARFVPAHEDLVEAMRLFDSSMDKLKKGVKDVDADLVNEASDLMLDGSEKMQSAADKLEALGQ